MVMISMPGGGEARTPSYHNMGSPRYGGCIGAFLHFFDWNPGKRFYSTKRLPASKPEDGMRRSRSMRSDHGSTARARMICDAQRREDAVAAEESSSASHDASSHAAPGIILGDDAATASSRVPSVVARLMGLESLPKGPYQPSTRHRRSQSYSGAGELPFAFMTVTVDQKQQAPVLLQDLLQRDLKTASKKTLRDRIPGFAKRAQEQYENRFTKKGAALKVLRCRQDECISPYIDIPDIKSKPSPKQPFLLRLAPEETHVAPEVSSQATGWPLAGKVSRESSFRSERSSLLESESSSSRTKSSKPALANVARKIFQGRRRAAGTTGSWNGASEDSESNSSQVELAENPLIRAPRKSRVTGRELALKKVAKSLSPPPARHRAVRMKAATHHEAFARDFKPAAGSRIPGGAQSTRTKSITEDIASEPLIPTRARSTDFQSGTQDSNPRAPETPTVTAKTLNRPVAKATRNTPSRISKPDHPKKAPPLDGYRTPKMTKAVKPGSLAKQTTKNTLQGIQRVRETMLVDRLMAAPDQASVDDTDGSTNIGVRGYRKNGKHARARSIDEVFPELPLDAKPCDPCGPNIRLENEPVSTEPCDVEVLKPVPAASCAESMTEQVFHVDLQEFFAAGPDDLSWEDEECVEQRVNSPSVSGRFCELRSCSGLSVSSASVDNVSDVDDERNGDAWSSCASYNPADCDSPRTFELPDTDADEADLHEPKSTPMIFAKKVSDDDHEATVGAEQPSPVSILNSPFHDEAGTTDEDGFLKSSGSGNSSTCESSNLSTPAPLKSYEDNDKIRQALLDISMFQSFTFDYNNNNKELSKNPKESEQGFVREILSAANLMSEGSSPDRFDQNVAIDPSLFDRLESGDIEESAGGVEKMIQARSGGLWRCDRKLLFDCVNEAFALTLWQSWCSELGLQWYASSRPRGQKLVEEVYKKIEDWRKFTFLSVDFLIERDMGVRCGDWKSFSAEVVEVGMDIESMLWKAIVEEVVMDMVASFNR